MLFALIAGTAQAQSFPKFTGLVVDAANVLPQDVEADLTAKLDALQRDTKRQLVVATIPDLQGYPIEDYGYRLGREWGVGLRDVSNGAILFVAPNEPAGHRGPRIEVGYGLEGIITDALASTIIRGEMMPRLRSNDLPAAMVAGTDALIRQLRASPEEARGRLEAAAREFDQTYRRETQDGTSSGGIPISLIFWGLIFLFVVLPLLRGRGRTGSYGRHYRSSGANLPIILWSIGNELGRSRGNWGSGGGGFGGWSGGGSDGSWGGGGFTGGGGGSFGGGGASGDW